MVIGKSGSYHVSVRQITSKRKFIDFKKFLNISKFFWIDLILILRIEKSFSELVTIVKSSGE